MLWVIVFLWHGSIVSRVTNLDVRNAKRWIRGFRHSVVQKRCKVFEDLFYYFRVLYERNYTHPSLALGTR
jgi:putative SOS response-associated peptidase YedK